MGNNINVTIVHPIDRSTVQVELDPTLSAKETIKMLADEGFMSAGDYSLSVKGSGIVIPEGQTLQSSGVKEGDSLALTPATDAGLNNCPHLPNLKNYGSFR